MIKYSIIYINDVQGFSACAEDAPLRPDSDDCINAAFDIIRPSQEPFPPDIISYRPLHQFLYSPKGKLCQ